MKQADPRYRRPLYWNRPLRTFVVKRLTPMSDEQRQYHIDTVLSRGAPNYADSDIIRILDRNSRTGNYDNYILDIEAIRKGLMMNS